MNYLNVKTMILALAIFSISSVQAEWKFGVAIGLSNIDYELTEVSASSISPSTDGEDFTASGNVKTRTWDVGYSAPEITFDVRNGKHAFSYKVADGDISDWDDAEVPAIDPADYNLGYSNTVDREEWTFGYAYSLNNNWLLSLGIYEGTLNRDYDRDFSNSYNLGTNSEYSWISSNDGLAETVSEGTYIAIGYQNKISDKVFWFAKLGYQTNELTFTDSWTFSESFNATDASFQEYANNYFNDTYNFQNGTYSIDEVARQTSDGNSAVIGLGFVYAFNAKDTLTLEFEGKAYSYDPATVEYISCVTASVFCNSEYDQDTYDALSDETASYVTLRYRHSF